MVQKTATRCSESPPLPVNFPTVLIAGMSACHKNIQPVQIYLRSSPRALWLSPNLHSFTHSPLLHVFFNPYQSCLASRWCDTNKEKNRNKTKKKYKKLDDSVKASLEIAGQLHEKQTSTTRDGSGISHRSSSEAAAVVAVATTHGPPDDICRRVHC